jgi:hypothetical protein
MKSFVVEKIHINDNVSYDDQVFTKKEVWVL